VGSSSMALSNSAAASTYRCSIEKLWPAATCVSASSGSSSSARVLALWAFRRSGSRPPRAKKVDVRGCEARPSGGEIWIEFDGSLEHLSGKLYALACPLLEEFPRPKIKLVCLHVLR